MNRKIYIRDIKSSDVSAYQAMIQPDKEYHRFDGPYYSHMSEEKIQDYIQEIKSRLSNGEIPLPHRKMIVDKSNEDLIGQVNWYWKSEETGWLEVGIVIFNENCWGMGIGTAVLPLWIDEVFKLFPNIVRIGVSTWSGNLRMIKLAEKIGLHKEAEYRNARIVDGKYYDSLSYGILKEDWATYSSIIDDGD